MAQPQLSIRSTKAHELAHRLAHREHRSVADIVERALEAYEQRESPAAFYARLTRDHATDIDLEAIVQENRKGNPGPEF